MNEQERAAAFSELKPTLESFQQWAELTNNWRGKYMLRNFFACLESLKDKNNDNDKMSAH